MYLLDNNEVRHQESFIFAHLPSLAGAFGSHEKLYGVFLGYNRQNSIKLVGFEVRLFTIMIMDLTLIGSKMAGTAWGGDELQRLLHVK